MRTIGLDIGDRRIGVAIGRVDEGIATPLCVLDATDVVRASREIEGLISEWDVERVIVGLPLTLAGEEGPQARHVRTRTERLLERMSLPVTFVDERYSSTDAERILAEAGLSAREARGRVDSIAASLILQTYLDGREASTDKGVCDGA